MDTLSPEILHIVCSFLSIENVLRFRQVNRAFADIGAAHMLPEVSFYMFDDEFQRLRDIANHPIIAKHVRSLTYFAEVMDNELAPFSAFVRENRGVRLNDMTSFLRGRDPEEPLTMAQLHKTYKDYEAIMKKQEHIVENHTDVACLKEVIPKFTSLRQATMSSGHEFYEGKRNVRKVRNSPFKLPIPWPGSDLQPEGKRHLNGLIAGLIGSECQLESFRAGVIDWKFFKNFSQVPERLAHTLKYLKRIEIAIDADPQENVRSIAHCRKVMETGIIRKLLKPLEHLEVLHVTLYPVEWAEEEWPASLEDIITPDYKWPHLKEIVLGGFMTNRHDMMKFLELHKGTMKRLCLRDIGLGETSWWKFLPDIRNKLDVEDVCICGDIVGNSEDESLLDPTEYWDLSTPDVCRHKLRESINAYCRGSKAYPDEVPLDKSVVEEYYSEFVADGEEEDESLLAPDRRGYGPDPFEWESDVYDEEDYFEHGTGDLDMLAQLIFGGAMMGMDDFGEVDPFDVDWEEEDDDDEAGDDEDEDHNMPDLFDPDATQY